MSREFVEPVDSFIRRNLNEDRDNFDAWKKEQDAMRAAKAASFPIHPQIVPRKVTR